jgi:hypothetical protein
MDAIDKANNKSAGKDAGYVSTPSKSSESKSERIAKLPRVKTPEIIQREQEANAQSSKAESDRITLLQKEETDVEIKKKIFTDTPEEYKKVEKYIEMCTEINLVRKDRIKTSNENVTKSKKAFTYPMKNVGKKQPEEPAPELPIANTTRSA